MKKETEEFDWKDMYWCLAKICGDNSEKLTNLCDLIKMKCVPKESYETARTIAEETHRELECLQGKMERILAWAEKDITTDKTKERICFVNGFHLAQFEVDQILNQQEK